MSNSSLSRTPLSERFRGFLPVVVDVETGGFDAHRHALLEIAVQPVISNDEGWLEPGTMISTHVIPHEGGQLDPRSLAVNGIDPWHPLRAARSEKAALDFVCKPIHQALKEHHCHRAILVGHNAHSDLGFLNAAVRRTGFRRNPFHAYSVFDTVTLAAWPMARRCSAAPCAPPAGLGRRRSPFGPLRCRPHRAPVLPSSTAGNSSAAGSVPAPAAGGGPGLKAPATAAGGRHRDALIPNKPDADLRIPLRPPDCPATAALRRLQRLDDADAPCPHCQIPARA